MSLRRAYDFAVNTRTLILAAAIAAIMVCAVVLTLMGLGVSGVLGDLTYVIWPSSVILLVTWRTTPLGIAVTAFSVLLNCASYVAVALLGRTLIRSAARVFS